jgi:hypothetical protein
MSAHPATRVQWAFVSALGYLISPLDLWPDARVGGYIDDVAMTGLAMWFIARQFKLPAAAGYVAAYLPTTASEQLVAWQKAYAPAEPVVRKGSWRVGVAWYWHYWDFGVRRIPEFGVAVASIGPLRIAVSHPYTPPDGCDDSHSTPFLL